MVLYILSTNQVNRNKKGKHFFNNFQSNDLPKCGMKAIFICNIPHPKWRGFFRILQDFILNGTTKVLTANCELYNCWMTAIKKSRYSKARVFRSWAGRVYGLTLALAHRCRTCHWYPPGWPCTVTPATAAATAATDPAPGWQVNSDVWKC